MNAKRFLTFAGKVTVALVVTTFLVGLVSYPLLTKELFENPDSIMHAERLGVWEALCLHRGSAGAPGASGG
jgi:hypothetical protein